MPDTQTTPPAVRRLLVIEDGLLVNMAMNSSFVAAFPFLAPLQTQHSARVQGGGCGSCGRRNQERRRLFSAAKAAIANLDDDSKRRLKQMLNAQQVRVQYADGGGRTFQVNF